MASDTMDIDDATAYYTYVNSPSVDLHDPSWIHLPSRVHHVPAPMAGRKRTRFEFEAPAPEPVRFIYNNPKQGPDGPKESYLPSPPPVQRFFMRIGGGTTRVAGKALVWTGARIRKGVQHAMNYLAKQAPAPSAIPSEKIAVVEVGHKRRAVMPGSYPVSPEKRDAVLPSSSLIIKSSIATHNAHLKPAQDSPFTKLCKLRPAKTPVLAAPTQPIVVATARPTRIAAAPKATMSVPTPPSSRPSSSSGPTKPQQPFMQSPEPQEPKKPVMQPGQLKPRPSGSYAQPFSPLKSQPRPIKPILKQPKADPDAAIDELIYKAKTVVIESPEQQAVRHTFRRRKMIEALTLDRDLQANREREEERQYQEAQAAHLAKVRAAQAAKEEKARLLKEAEDRKIAEAEEEIRALKLEAEEKERIRKEEEAKQAAEAKAEQKRRSDERKKKKEAEAEERRVAHEAKLAAKRASEQASSSDDDQLDLDRQLQILKTLSSEWEEKVYTAMGKTHHAATVATSPDGVELTRKDFGTLLPQANTPDSPSGWLNDEIINAFIGTIVASKKEQTGWKKTSDETPVVEAYATAWYKNYAKGGITAIKSWSRRKKLQGAKLLNAHKIFFPVNESNSHWSLLVISPYERRIEFLDSLHTSGKAKKFCAIAREWLAMELGPRYKPEEWRDDLDSISMRQLNFNDCGVFTCFNALASAKFFPFECIDPHRMAQGRKLAAAILIKGKLNNFLELE